MQRNITFTFCIFFLLKISKHTCICKDSEQVVLSPEENPIGDLFEGDIEVGDTEEEVLEDGVAGAGIIGDHYRWPQHTIPYVISREFEPENRDEIIRDAMKEIANKTCINFKPRDDERDYIYIQSGPSGCSSSVGRRGDGRQEVTLSIKGRCVQKGIAIHELVHTIGFWHEQSRTDRDKYIEIKTANINKEKVHNFNAYTSKAINDFGVPYDYDSVMHYHETAFISPEAYKKGLKTIVPRKKGVQIGQRSYLSKLDALKIIRMYCPEEEEMMFAVKKPKIPIATTTTTTTEKPRLQNRWQSFIMDQILKQKKLSKFNFGGGRKNNEIDSYEYSV